MKMPAPVETPATHPTVAPRVADLHLHTFFSDGTFSPEELARRARENGLNIVALTDHDTVEGCGRMAYACGEEGLEFIPGTELTAECAGLEVHILGYWLDTEDPALLSALGKFQRVRQDRIVEMVRRLNGAGVPITVDSVSTLAGCNSPGRPHVARALVASGLANDFDSAFERFLKKGRVAFVPKARMAAATAVDLIHAAGGVAVLAHPGLYRNDGLIPQIAAVGLDGLECWHTKHSAGQCTTYAALATRLNLVATGGSDCHGMAKDQPLVGTVKVPAKQVELLSSKRGGRGSAPRPA